MPDVWTPGCVVDPGLLAGYGAGRNRMEIVKLHATAGENSYGVCRNNGLCQWLVPYDGPPWQFAEADAYCYDSGPYNDDGPGIEIERPVTGGIVRPGLSEFRPMSPSQIEWTGKIVHWLHDEWGVPLDLYDGPRFGSAGFRGFVNHGDLDDQRTDGVTRDEWDAMTGAPIDWAAVLAYLEEIEMNADQDARLKNVEKGLGQTNAQLFGPQGIGEDIKSRIAALDKKVDKLPAATGGGGLSEDQVTALVRAVVRDELDKTKLGH